MLHNLFFLHLLCHPTCNISFDFPCRKGKQRWHHLPMILLQKRYTYIYTHECKKCFCYIYIITTFVGLHLVKILNVINYQPLNYDSI
ncbi:hypothetical protein HanRHA438_Chr14g0667381 [Helianthus annuus]|nr:hypothetical protein HanRHA438_Chr14g0667381 [Helianthus annuus]